MKIARLATFGVLIVLSLSLLLVPTAYAQSAVGYSDNTCATTVTSSAAGIPVYGGGTNLVHNNWYQIVYSGAASGSTSGIKASGGNPPTICDSAGITPGSAGTLTITINLCGTSSTACGTTTFQASTNVTITGTPTFPLGVAPIVVLIVVIYMVLLRNKRAAPPRFSAPRGRASRIVVACRTGANSILTTGPRGSLRLVRSYWTEPA